MTATSAAHDSPSIVWNMDVVIATRDYAEERLAVCHGDDVAWWEVLRDKCELMLEGSMRDDAIWGLLEEYAITDEGCAGLLGSH